MKDRFNFEKKTIIDDLLNETNNSINVEYKLRQYLDKLSSDDFVTSLFDNVSIFGKKFNISNEDLYLLFCFIKVYSEIAIKKFDKKLRR